MVLGDFGIDVLLWTGGWLLLLWLLQAVPVFLYWRTMGRRDDKSQHSLASWPRIDIFVPVRAGGLHLRSALEHLLSLDYPNFHVRVVVDHPTDAANSMIESMQLRQYDPRLNVEWLENRAANRSLLCSSLVQFYEKLDDSCDLIAFCGADMNLPKRFLHDLAVAMQAPEIGSTLGNRWYVPQPQNWGSVVRYTWNAGAVVPMWVAQIPWGGACALRPADVQRSGLIDVWKAGMVEDAPIKSAIDKLGMQLKFVPNLLVVSHDTITLADFFEFLKRQLLWTRLYYPNWAAVVINALLLNLTMLIPWVLACVAIWENDLRLGILFAAAGLSYWCGLAFLIWLVDQAATGVIRANGQKVCSKSFSLWMRIFVVIPIGQLAHTAAVVASCFLRKVSWSGIEYEIHGPKNIRLIRYMPANPSTPPVAETFPTN